MHKFNRLRAQIIVIGDSQPIVCPVCNFVPRNSEDVMSIKKETACLECTVNFKYLNFERWNNGWRPSIGEARAKMHI